MLKSGKTWIWLAVAILAVGGAWFGWKRHKAKQDQSKDWVEATKGDLIVKYQEVGEIEPKLKVDVKSNATGRITKLLVEEGDRVRKGQLLAVVQPGQTAAERYMPYEVRSPISGTVIKRHVEVGDVVVSGLAEFGAGTVLMTVGDLGRMVVEVDVNEVDVPKISLHQKADVHLDALPNESFDGEIAFISPMAELNDQKVKIFETKVDILKSDPRLRPGMTASISVLLAKRPGVVQAPIEAIFQDGKDQVAYVLGADPKAPPSRRVVRTGLQDEVNFEILDGLKPGEKLSLSRPEDKKNG